MASSSHDDASVSDADAPATADLHPTAPAPSTPPGGGYTSMPTFDASLLDDWVLRVGLIALACLIFFPGLGSFGLWDPWEVHYGEVGRQMIERGDWITPWWGSHWNTGTRAPEGEFFFSKPVLLLWTMGIGLLTFGFSETGIRLGVAVAALLGVASVYLLGARVFHRRVGVLMAVALLTSPFYAMLGRQAQTDMMFVGPMTVALSFFLLGLFGKDRDRPLDRVTFWGFVALFVVLAVPQYHTILVGQLDWRDDLRGLEALICWGPFQLVAYLVCVFLFFFTALRRRTPTRGQFHLWMFYVFVGLATMGKGLLGFAMPGAIILLYLIVTREWSILRRAEIGRGILLALAIGFPWYGAVLARHGGVRGPFWERFIIHDHFKRLASGVHQIDTGSFEHFIKWLGYGLFPWGSLVPVILARAFTGESGSERTDEDRVRLFLFLWFAVAFTLFTLSSTKFHHYIFPAVPPLALLAALTLDDGLAGRISFQRWWPLYTGALVLLALVGFDLISDPQHLKNLFTYRYDREWGADVWNPGFQSTLRGFFALAVIGFLLLAHPSMRRTFRAGVLILAIQGTLFAVWALNVYMPTISPTWSQKYLWDHYYEICTQVDPPDGAPAMKNGRYCMESAISYKLNWRGETYYTQNEILPVRDDKEWEYFLEVNGDRCFYAIMDHGRVNTFRNALPAEQRDSVQREHTDNLKFVLVSANCTRHDDASQPGPEGEDGEAQPPVID
jgi:4-amino-4-deoxy-L-arabinose transferase-like glycosyltransferase